MVLIIGFPCPASFAGVLLILSNIIGVHSYQINQNGIIGTHEKIISMGLEVLLKDNLNDVYAFFKPCEVEMRNAQTSADMDGGSLLSIPRNSFSHFYNPNTKEGFRTGLLGLGNIVGKLALASGPGIPSTEMANWRYSGAVEAMRAGDKKQACFLLGYAIHYVQDATVPQHATDCGSEKSECRHTEYEQFVNDEVMYKVPVPSNNLYLGDSTIPADYVIAGAAQSAPLLTKTKLDPAQSMETKTILTSIATSQIQHAARLTAGMMYRFFKLWKDEKFRVVYFRINQLMEKKGLSCKNPNNCKTNNHFDIEGDGGFSDIFNSDADFYPEVTMNLKDASKGGLKRRGYSIDIREMTVKALDTFDVNSWTYTEWFKTDRGVATVSLHLYDVYANVCGSTCGKIEREVDLMPPPGTQGLEIDFPLDNYDKKILTFTGCDNTGTCNHAAEIVVTISTQFNITSTRAADCSSVKCRVGTTPGSF